jgi:uncharacterized protein (TIGR02611 family)
MANLRERWKKMPVVVRKPLIFIAGSSLIFTGLALLFLPGPGWAAIFLGFAVLATEFAFAEKARDWFIKELKTIGRNTRNRWRGFWKRS